ncbi:hypothetical protein LCGC14_2294730 [marine sediment metagenome]|uniref:Uncharacterized protein n=1 Tax=marine sediment metagenome TaxID=412755 RepID=A0A0F9CQ69_9ZZZZ
MSAAEREERIERIAKAFHKSLGCSVCSSGEPCDGLAELVSMIRHEVETI